MKEKLDKIMDEESSEILNISEENTVSPSKDDDSLVRPETQDEESPKVSDIPEEKTVSPSKDDNSLVRPETQDEESPKISDILEEKTVSPSKDDNSLVRPETQDEESPKISDIQEENTGSLSKDDDCSARTETQDEESSKISDIPEENTVGLSEEEDCLVRTETQEIISRNKPYRSNSVCIDRQGNRSPITPATRNAVNNVPFEGNQWQDEFKLAVFSQEASKHFTKAYQQKVKSVKSHHQVLQNSTSSDMPADIQRALTGTQRFFTAITKHDEAISLLLQNKEKPHVIAVIEGARTILEEKVLFKENDETFVYLLNANYLQGQNVKGHTDDKQSMHFYVREDMSNAVKIHQESIEISSDNSEFQVGHIFFETQSECYGVLVPHIPNRCVKTKAACDETVKAFQACAAKLKAEGCTLVGYFGDTNYNQMMQARRVALARERFRDVPVPEIDSQTREAKGRERPVSGTIALNEQCVRLHQ